MSAKRRAVKDLTDRNWDQEDEPEDPGMFARASSDVMEKRVIKRAATRSRIAGSDDAKSDSDTPKTTFAGFAGFGTTNVSFKPPEKDANASQKPAVAPSTQPSPHLPDFNFKNAFTTAATGGSDDAPFKFSSTPIFAGASQLNNNNSGGKDGKASERKDGDGKACGDSAEYYRHMKCLNATIVAWISKHVAENPCCILTPCFADYDKHAEHIADTYQTFSKPADDRKAVDACSPSTSTAENAASATQKPAQFSFNKLFQPTTTEASTPATTQPTVTPPAPTQSSTTQSTATTSVFSGFKFASSTSDNPSQSKAENKPFSFSSTKASTFGGFGMASGFSFASSTPPATSLGSTSALPSTTENEDEYVPPEPEVSDATEEGAVYSTKCKLFYQKDGQWMVRGGVCNMHLKVVDDKCQLIMRADNNMGTIVLNIVIPASLPVKRQGKNNVFLLCVPNPHIDPKLDASTPVPLLIRVKAESDADELLAKINELRKAA